MRFLINLILAILAGFLSRYILNSLKVTDPVAVLLAILVGILVFFMDLAASIL